MSAPVASSSAARGQGFPFAFYCLPSPASRGVGGGPPALPPRFFSSRTLLLPGPVRPVSCSVQSPSFPDQPVAARGSMVGPSCAANSRTRVVGLGGAAADMAPTSGRVDATWADRHPKLGPGGRHPGGPAAMAGTLGRWRATGHDINRLWHRRQKPERGAECSPLLPGEGPKGTKPNGRARTRPDRWAPHFQRENGGWASDPE
jgi:hypothetical protein